MEKIVDYLAKEEADIDFEEAVQKALQQAKRVKMTEQQRLEYKLYRAACRINNVEPVRADFLAGEINSGVIRDMELEQNENEQSRRKAFAATA